MSLTSTADQRRTTQPRKRGWAATAGLVVLAWVLICAVLVGWGWLLTHSLEKSIDPTDNDIARWFADERTSGLEPYADAGTFLGETIVGASAFTVVGILVSLVRRTWIPILLVAILETGLGAYYFVATHLITRDRPPVKILDAGLDPNASFPSGHTATALVFCVGTLVLIWTYFRSARWWFVWLLLLPVGTVLARLYQGAHHLTDVLTSVVYASVWLAVVAALVLPRRVIKITDANGCLDDGSDTICIETVKLGNGQPIGSVVFVGPKCTTVGGTVTVYLLDVQSCTVNLLVDYTLNGSSVRTAALKSDNISSGNVAGDCVPAA